jgi:hypothetical protein
MGKTKSPDPNTIDNDKEFSTLVSTLISVFTTSLDLVSKLRGRRRRRRGRGQRQLVDQSVEKKVDVAESELRQSLSRASAEIENGYRGGIRGLGGRFEGGDGE